MVGPYEAAVTPTFPTLPCRALDEDSYAEIVADVSAGKPIDAPQVSLWERSLASSIMTTPGRTT